MKLTAIGSNRLELQEQIAAAQKAGKQDEAAQLEDQLDSLNGMDGTKNYRLSKYDKYLNFANDQKDEAATRDFTWKVDKKANKIKLDNGYQLAFNEKRSQLLLEKVDSQGEIRRSTRIWGDPHIDVGNNGKNNADFYKDTSLLLEDGTKITIGTRSKGEKETYSDVLTITRGDQAVKVTGLMQGEDALEIGDLSWDGKKLDSQTNDGHLMYENGTSWNLENGKSITENGKHFKFAEEETQNEVDWRVNGQAPPAKQVHMGGELRWFLRAENIRFADSDGDSRLTEAEWAKLIDSIQLHQSMLDAEESMQMALLLDMIQDFDKTLTQDKPEDETTLDLDVSPIADIAV